MTQRAGANVDATDRQPLGQTEPLVYSAPARTFHWLTAAIVIVMIPLGFLIAYEGPMFKLPEALGNGLASAHKLIGFLLLWLVIARLIYRLRNGAPPDEPTLDPLQKGVAHATHWLLYLLLIAVPLSGWIGISLYGARELFELFSLPPLTGVDQKASDGVFAWHLRGAVLILFLASAHVAAALYHYFIRKDGVLRRMLPNLDRS